MSNTNIDESAVEAAADRLLSERRSASIAKAEQALSKGNEQLAVAEVARTNASREMLTDTSDRARKDALSADDVARACALKVEALEAEVTAAKARITPAEKEAATALVTARRKWNDIPARRKVHMMDVQLAAAELLRVLAEGSALCLDATFIGSELQDRSEQLGESVLSNEFYVADAKQISASAILDACVQSRYSPFDFRDLGQSVAAAAAMARPVPADIMPIASSPESRKAAAASTKAHLDALHQRAYENGLANTAEFQRTGRVSGKESVQSAAYVPRVTDPS